MPRLKRKQGKDTVDYGLGGAILAGVNAFRNKQGLVGGLKSVAKAYATPGSGIAQGAKLAGGLLAKSQNPALGNIGRAASLASNFMPGGGGVAGLAGNAMQNLGGGSGIASVMQPLRGLFQQDEGGLVPAEPLTSKQFRQSERARSRAERDAAIVERGAKSVDDLLSNLSQYDERKDKRAIVQQMIRAGAIALGGVGLSNLRYPQNAAGMSMVEYIKELRRLNR